MQRNKTHNHNTITRVQRKKIGYISFPQAKKRVQETRTWQCSRKAYFERKFFRQRVCRRGEKGSVKKATKLMLQD